MEEQLISFETAKLVKEKGFNEKCIWYYCGNQHKLKQINLKGLQNSDFISFTSAPTQSLLQKWLREKHNIHIEIDAATDEECNVIFPYKYQWGCYINNQFKYGIIYYDKYEDALEIGLQEALKLIK